LKLVAANLRRALVPSSIIPPAITVTLNGRLAFRSGARQTVDQKLNEKIVAGGSGSA